MPSRRQVLGTVAVGLCGAFAGCADPAGVLQMRPSTTETLVDATTRNVTANAPAEVRDLLEELRENGSATVEDRRPPLQVDRPVAFRDRLYDVSMSETGERTRTDYQIEVDLDPADASGTETAFEDLPAVDRDVLEPLLGSLRAGDPPSNEGVDVGTRRHYTDAELESSVLVPEQEVEVVVVDGDPVRVRTEPTEVTVTEYRYEATERDESLEAYADDLRATYRFALTALSDDEREVVDEAVDGGSYYASSTDDDAYEGVARAFLEHEPVTNDGSEGGWIADYDGETYWAELDVLQFGDLRDELEAKR